MKKKQEFLDILKTSLSGNIPEENIKKHIDYYSDYIDNEVRMGMTQEQVIENLDDPRLIAKTIINTEGNSYNGYDYGNNKEKPNDNTRSKKKRFTSGLGRIVGIVFIIVFLLLLFMLLGGVFLLLIKFALPLIIIVLVIILIRRLR
jgi:uncharacterized membrane protein